MSIPSRGSTNQSIRRTQRWYVADTGGEFVPIVSAVVAPFDPATGFDWSEQPAAWQQPPWFHPPDTGTLLPDLTVAAVDAQADLWLEQPGQEAPIRQVWDAPDAAHAPPILLAILPLDPALQPLDHDEQQQGLSLDQRWFTPPDTGTPFQPLAPFDPATGFDWSEQPQAWQQPPWFTPDDAGTPRLITAVDVQAALWPEQPAAWQQPPWFQPDPEAIPPIPNLTVASVDAQADLWLEQPQAWQPDRWFQPDDVGTPFQPPAAAYNPSAFPFDDSLGALPPTGLWNPAALVDLLSVRSFIAATATTGTVPAVLINAENGDVFLYIGGIFIVPAS